MKDNAGVMEPDNFANRHGQQESRHLTLEGPELASKLECTFRELEDLGFHCKDTVLCYSSLWEPVACLAGGRPHPLFQCLLVKVKFTFCHLWPG